ncbi:Hypothetical Protein FCC1311_112612 [Hondaea fermentalgiana]|uniref:Uncharacterized protein n=1 Tax=Hondaea fermentalgiana TaxID=2315210 RepID=A0A2R5GYZ2_9STRA|nr:Hypothetical Protein FCC1311_112612 [Hondaea fermentalgiana]|eukprot:GBG35038.1 Hypothetical Protein FCC1311_112612 [Hondaea fermentalgiana]
MNRQQRKRLTVARSNKALASVAEDFVLRELGGDGSAGGKKKSKKTLIIVPDSDEEVQEWVASQHVGSVCGDDAGKGVARAIAQNTSVKVQDELVFKSMACKTTATVQRVNLKHDERSAAEAEAAAVLEAKIDRLTALPAGKKIHFKLSTFSLLVTHQDSFWAMVVCEIWFLVNFMIENAEHLFPRAFGAAKYKCFWDSVDTVIQFLGMMLGNMPSVAHPIENHYLFLDVMCGSVVVPLRGIVDELCGQSSFLGPCSTRCGGAFDYDALSSSVAKTSGLFPDVLRFLNGARRRGKGARGGAARVPRANRGDWFCCWLKVRDMAINVHAMMLEAQVITRLVVDAAPGFKLRSFSMDEVVSSTQKYKELFAYGLRNKHREHLSDPSAYNPSLFAALRADFDEPWQEHQQRDPAWEHKQEWEQEREWEGFVPTFDGYSRPFPFQAIAARMAYLADVPVCMYLYPRCPSSEGVAAWRTRLGGEAHALFLNTVLQRGVVEESEHPVSLRDALVLGNAGGYCQEYDDNIFVSGPAIALRIRGEVNGWGVKEMGRLSSDGEKLGLDRLNDDMHRGEALVVDEDAGLIAPWLEFIHSGSNCNFAEGPLLPDASKAAAYTSGLDGAAQQQQQQQQQQQALPFNAFMRGCMQDSADDKQRQDQQKKQQEEE